MPSPSARTLRARELYADGDGLGYKRIAKELGVSRDKARDMVRPDRRARLSRNQYRRGTCEACEGPMYGKPGYIGLCQACRRDRHADTQTQIVALWAEGKTIAEIADLLDWQPTSVRTYRGRALT